MNLLLDDTTYMNFIAGTSRYSYKKVQDIYVYVT